MSYPSSRESRGFSTLSIALSLNNFLTRHNSRIYRLKKKSWQDKQETWKAGNETKNTAQQIYLFYYLFSSCNIDISFWTAGCNALDDIWEIFLNEVDVSRETGLMTLVTY
jgi:hypothetical protein